MQNLFTILLLLIVALSTPVSGDFCTPCEDNPTCYNACEMNLEYCLDVGISDCSTCGAGFGC